MLTKAELKQRKYLQQLESDANKEQRELYQKMKRAGYRVISYNEFMTPNFHSDDYQLHNGYHELSSVFHVMENENVEFAYIVKNPITFLEEKNTFIWEDNKRLWGKLK